VSDPKQPETMTPNQLRALADRFEREAAALTARAKQLRGAADTIEAIRAMGPLTSDVSYATDNSMSSAIAIGPSRGPAPDKDGPATKVMTELGFANLAELAKALGERHGTVRSWNLRAEKDGLPERVRPAVQKLREKRSRARGK